MNNFKLFFLVVVGVFLVEIIGCNTNESEIHLDKNELMAIYGQFDCEILSIKQPAKIPIPRRIMENAQNYNSRNVTNNSSITSKQKTLLSKAKTYFHKMNNGVPFVSDKESYSVLILRTPDVNESYVANRARDFGLTDVDVSAVSYDGDCFVVKKNNLELYINPESGSETFLDTSRSRIWDGNPIEPDDDKLKTIAWNYINQFGDVNLDEVVFNKIKKLVRVVYKVSTGEKNKQIEESTVVFGRRVNGLDVIGPGSRIAVSILNDPLIFQAHPNTFLKTRCC